MTQNANEKKAKEKLNPFIKAYLYSYLIVFLIIVITEKSPLSDFISTALTIPLILPIVPFFTFVIDSLYLLAIIIYGVILFFLFKLPYKFSRHKTLIFTLILLLIHLVGALSAALIIPRFVA